MVKNIKETKSKEHKADKTISLEGIDIRDFFGINNNKFSKIVSFFPRLKLVNRGQEIKVFGEKKEVNFFVNQFSFLLDYYDRYNSLSIEVIEDMLSDDSSVKQNLPADVILFGNKGEMIRARTENQKKLVNDFDKNDLMFAVGPAGTGKTYTAIALAVAALKNNEIKRIILTRPAVEAGESLGFLPGDLKDKLDPYLQPLYDALFDMLPRKKIEQYFEDRTIEIAPLAFMRGRTLGNACVILDEAQNATSVQLKMFLTRMGKNSSFIVTGDMSQIDLPKKGHSGLEQTIDWLKNIKGVQIIEFNKTDIVRHRLVIDIVKAFEIGEENNNQ